MLAGSTEFPEGFRVRGRGLRDPEPEGPEPDYGLYLGLGKLRDYRPAWEHEWVDWPDFRTPRHFDTAVSQLRGVYERARSGQAVELACAGGRGRTGTAMACLAVLSGVPAAEAVAWTRAHYNAHAVETPWQKRWVLRFSRA